MRIFLIEVSVTGKKLKEGVNGVNSNVIYNEKFASQIKRSDKKAEIFFENNRYNPYYAVVFCFTKSDYSRCFKRGSKGIVSSSAKKISIKAINKMKNICKLVEKGKFSYLCKWDHDILYNLFDSCSFSLFKRNYPKDRGNEIYYVRNNFNYAKKNKIKSVNVVLMKANEVINFFNCLLQVERTVSFEKFDRCLKEIKNIQRKLFCLVDFHKKSSNDFGRIPYDCFCELVVPYALGYNPRKAFLKCKFRVFKRKLRAPLKSLSLPFDPLARFSSSYIKHINNDPESIFFKYRVSSSCDAFGKLNDTGSDKLKQGKRRKKLLIKKKTFGVHMKKRISFKNRKKK